MSDAKGYSALHIGLHWLTAVAVIVAWFTHEGMEDAARAVFREGASPFPTPHTIAGFVAFVAVLIRLILRRTRGAPEPAGEGLQQVAAIWGHRALYLLLFVVPLIGAMNWFGGIRAVGFLHEPLAKALMVLALGHAAMALWHHYAKKDGTLTRMLKPGSE